MRTAALTSPSNRATTRATLMPPPPGSRRSGAQRNLWTGSICSTEVIAFLKDVAVRINEEAERFDELILCAPPRPLGILREHLSESARERMRAEVAKDYLHQKATELGHALEHAIP